MYMHGSKAPVDCYRGKELFVLSCCPWVSLLYTAIVSGPALKAQPPLGSPLPQVGPRWICSFRVVVKGNSKPFHSSQLTLWKRWSVFCHNPEKYTSPKRCPLMTEINYMFSGHSVMLIQHDLDSSCITYYELYITYINFTCYALYLMCYIFHVTKVFKRLFFFCMA